MYCFFSQEVDLAPTMGLALTGGMNLFSIASLEDSEKIERFTFHKDMFHASKTLDQTKISRAGEMLWLVVQKMRIYYPFHIGKQNQLYLS